MDGGPIAYVADGDRIRVDIAGRTIDLQVEESVLAERMAAPDWKPLPPYVTTGVLGKYAKLVRSAAEEPPAAEPRRAIPYGETTLTGLT